MTNEKCDNQMHYINREIKVVCPKCRHDFTPHELYEREDEWVPYFIHLNDHLEKKAKDILNNGHDYANGHGVTKDAEKANSFFLEAAKLGNADAMYCLANSYQRGIGLSRDVDKANDWYKKSAESGNAEAMFILGFHYAYGVGFLKDFNKACEWYLKSAKLVHTNSMVQLGYCYQNGNGVVKSEATAREWYATAANLGNITAMSFIATSYLTEGNKAKYLEWILKAVDLGDTQAMRSLGLDYEFGIGVHKDLSMASYWNRKADELDNLKKHE